MKTADKKHLQWIYNRLVELYDENPNYDYMIKFREILSQSTEQPEGVGSAEEAVYRKVFTKDGTPSIPDGQRVDTSLGDIKFFGNHIKNGIWKYHGRTIEWWLEKKSIQSIVAKAVEDCRDELLKQTFPMVHLNGYPSDAVPKGTILDLPALMKLKP